MAEPLGVSFMPDAQGNGSQQQNGTRPSPIQNAIQTLSLKIPRTVGASGGAPQSLLQGAGGAGLGGGNANAAGVLEQLRRMLFGNQPGTFQPPSLPRDGGRPMPGGMVGPLPGLPRDNGVPMPPPGRQLAPAPNIEFTPPNPPRDWDPDQPIAAAAPTPAQRPSGMPDRTRQRI